VFKFLYIQQQKVFSTYRSSRPIYVEPFVIINKSEEEIYNKITHVIILNNIFYCWSHRALFTGTDGSIIWKNSKSKICECLFCLIDDAADFSNIKSIINKIENLNPIFTYAIIHQKKDGEGTYDIFRLSKFSYPEHCNRVKIPKAHRKNNVPDNK